MVANRSFQGEVDDLSRRRGPRLMQRERRQLPGLIYRLRLLGMALGGIAIAAVLREQGASWPAWAWLGFTALAWPHVAYLVASRSTAAMAMPPSAMPSRRSR